LFQGISEELTPGLPWRQALSFKREEKRLVDLIIPPGLHPGATNISSLRDFSTPRLLIRASKFNHYGMGKTLTIEFVPRNLRRTHPLPLSFKKGVKSLGVAHSPGLKTRVTNISSLRDF
jgi:hypothetical protein